MLGGNLKTTDIYWPTPARVILRQFVSCAAADETHTFIASLVVNAGLSFSARVQIQHALINICKVWNRALNAILSKWWWACRIHSTA